MGYRVDKVLLSCDESLATYIIRDSFYDRYLTWFDLQYLLNDEQIKQLPEDIQEVIENSNEESSVIMISDKSLAEKIADML
jgi:TRAP-type mannitol/chloroaromatic compound transport system substrate-binding protein